MDFNNSSHMKFLYTMEYLVRFSDKDHPAVANDIIAYAAEHGIQLERKAIYRAIIFLNEFGVNIRSTGQVFYYIPSEGDIFHAFTNGKL